MTNMYHSFTPYSTIVPITEDRLFTLYIFLAIAMKLILCCLSASPLLTSLSAYRL